MAALFVCTKCHRRFPFDDLSHGDQLCKVSNSDLLLLVVVCSTFWINKDRQSSVLFIVVCVIVN